MALPFVSIITPTFNHEKYIGACIESVLRQDYSAWEQIIIDDGSSDDTGEVVRRYDDSRIRYVYQENIGLEQLARTYNRALSMSKGNLVAILEGDDLWPLNKLSTLVLPFSDDAVVLAYGAFADLSTDGTIQDHLARSVRMRMKLPSKILFNNPLGSATAYMLRADGVDLVPPSTVVIRRSALEAIGGFQYVPRLCVTDLPTFVTLSQLGKFHYTAEVMGYRRRHLESATCNHYAEILKEAQHYVTQVSQGGVFQLLARERKQIDRSWKQAKSPMKFATGRLKLVNGTWDMARADFVEALALSHPRILLASLAGWFLSWFHCDLEKLLRLVGVAHLEQADRRPQ